MDSSLIRNYFPEITAQQQAQFEALSECYVHWNAQINVISRKDIDELYVRHVLHSLGIAKVIQFKSGSKVLDVGTGGGFPGIPLAIMFPDVSFHLVDSIGKKIKVVEEVVKALDLKNVSAAHQRAEKVKGEFDFVVSRAVSRSKQLLHWTSQKLSKRSKHQFANGFFFLKGGDLEEELNEVNRAYQQFPLSDYFEEDFFETKKVVYIKG